MKPLEQRSYSFDVSAEETEQGSIITIRPEVIKNPKWGTVETKFYLLRQRSMVGR